MNSFSIKGNIVDVTREIIFSGELHIENGKIQSVQQTGEGADPRLPYLMPGLIDSHVHIESSMLVPAEFARLAVVHGTVATVSDPHEIANVCGMEGVHYMIDNGNTVNFKFYFGAPSCVPATDFETAGAVLTSNDIHELLAKKEIHYLSEMMNFPGVINDDEEVIKKITAAYQVSKPIDGHAPGLRGDALSKYISAGISTDHECFTREEALEKLALGMKIIIREGSAAKNFEALIELLDDYPNEIMFCSDDKHPDSLVEGHINLLCKRALQKDIDLFKVLKAACANPAEHYRLPVGLLREQDDADFIVVDHPDNFKVTATYIRGHCVAENGKTLIPPSKNSVINRFEIGLVNQASLSCKSGEYLLNGQLPVIEALDGQLITRKLLVKPRIVHPEVMGDPANDILKLVVVNRYNAAPPAVAFIKNFGIQRGAIASSVAHDSHNIIATGADDASITRAINLVIKHKGGISACEGEKEKVLPLPVAGLMSTEDGFEVARLYTEIDNFAKSLGSSLSAPFMTLSFMALLVIPSLKLSDKGLFDGETFRFVYR